MADQHECEECGETFDSKRGLSVHRAQVHETENGSKEQPAEESVNISLSVKQSLLAVFAIGLVVGFVGGSASPVGFAENAAAPSGNSDGSQNTRNQKLPINQNSVDVSRIELDGEPVYGDKDAPVTMVKYEDFECPFCQRFEQQTLPKIKNNYVESGKVKLVWKDAPYMPRTHPWSREAAKTMECVYRQSNEAFWAVEKKIFDNQNSITTDNVREKILSWASQEGVSKTAVKSCLENGNPMKEVNSDMEEGQSFDVTVSGRPFVGGTPAFVVYGDEKGTALQGAMPYEIFRQVIESELNR